MSVVFEYVALQYSIIVNSDYSTRGGGGTPGKFG